MSVKPYEKQIHIDDSSYSLAYMWLKNDGQILKWATFVCITFVYISFVSPYLKILLKFQLQKDGNNWNET